MDESKVDALTGAIEVLTAASLKSADAVVELTKHILALRAARDAGEVPEPAGIRVQQSEEIEIARAWWHEQIGWVAGQGHQF